MVSKVHFNTNCRSRMRGGTLYNHLLFLASAKPILPSETTTYPGTTTVLIQVPNITLTPTETTTLPWCITPSTKTERPNITTTSATIYSTELSTSTLQTTEIVTSTTVPEIVISTESVEGTTLEGSTVSATTESEITSRTFFTSETEISTTAETTTILPISPTTTEAEEQTTSTYVTELTETTSIATGTEETLTYSTEHPVYSTSDMSSSEQTTVLSTSTELFETTATNIPETSTEIKYTTLPDIDIESSTIAATSEAETSFITTIESTYTEYSTSSTIPSTISTFFTEEPKGGVVTTTTELTTLSTLPGISPTKVSTSEGTTVNIIDCTLPDKRCQNGGTCVFIDEAHKCVCPFDAEGPYCEIKLGIKNAAFTGNSYLSHLLPEGRNVSIEFTAKTLSNTGILFYTTLDETYMALYIENGYLVFKFSCGYQTMLLSELNVPVNNGYNMKIKAILEFSKNLTHCEALIKVNDTLTMTGDQTAMINKLLTPSACLHLGNIPNSLTYENIPSGGFIGCMSDLKVHGRNVYIYKDAEDGYEISECSSLACLSNPCKNGASCISSGEKWRCRCKNGFLGNMCELSICDDNPCLYGGTCIPFSSSGYLCLCPYGKHGHFCENDLKITEPYFSSSVRGLSSFITYPLPEGVSQNMEIRFRIVPTTIDQIALLLFMGQEGQHDAFSDHLAVSFVKGYIMLTWNMGSGPRRIFTSQPIEKGATDYLIQVGYTGRRAWLSVENLGNVTGRSPGNSVQLDIIPFLYLGGHHTRNFSTLPHDLPFHTGFSGCIFDLELRMGTIVLPLQGALRAVGRAVGQCGTTECYDRSCQNGGACLHHGNTFMCLCQDDWYGPLCSSRNNLCDKNITKCSDSSRCVPLLTDYECDCPFGQTGRYCEKNQTLTDLSFTGIRSYVRIHPVIVHNNKFNIEIEIRTLKDTGTILFVGSRDSSFLCLTLQNGLLELNIHSARTRSNAQDHLVVRSSKLLLKGVWHKVQFGVFGRKVYLYVDHIINIGVLGHGFTLSIPNSNIFLGGLPDMSQLPISVSSNLPEPFKGCLRHLSIDENIIPLIPENILDARNVGDCDGTPCGAESCLHGGTCWLDSFLVPHCSCIEPYYGKKCELVSKCSDKTCKNGICQNATCLCRVGFEGGICETEIEVKQPSFTGQSYLIVKKLKDKKRNIRDMELQTLSLNFTTAKNDGLILWTKKNKNFVGIGLENGYLKIVISSYDGKDKFMDIPPYYKVSDGLWHNIELKLLPFLLKIDGKTIKVKVDKNLGLLSVALDGIFFIGGLPSNMSLIKETDGLFHENFDGCVDSFGTNMETSVTDFSRAEGFNVNSCIVT